MCYDEKNTASAAGNKRQRIVKKEKTFIIGHKNPDTDSICSAIAYADIKSRTSKGSFVARRAGQINEETEFVLKYSIWMPLPTCRMWEHR